MRRDIKGVELLRDLIRIRTENFDDLDGYPGADETRAAESRGWSCTSPADSPANSAETRGFGF